LLFILFPLALFSQEKEGERPLVEILSILQEKHNYQFTYADDVVQGILIKELPDDLSFEEAIDYLKEETGLYFQFLDNNFVTIQHRVTSFYICGYVFDSETEWPLESATITGSQNSATSDSIGYFTLKVNQGDEKVIIRYLGYQILTMTVTSFNKEKCSNIFLIPQTYTISEVILSSYISKGISKLADGTFTINYQNFGILPGLIETDVLKTIQALPGIQSNNETVSTINIRGGTNDQNLLLWDGVRMYQSGHFFGLISAFNPLITTHVSVTKNGTSADYTSGVSGTIAMHTNSSINNHLTGSIGANFINIDGFVDVPLGKKSSLQLSARKAINDLYETPTYTKYFDRILQNTEVVASSTNIINSDIQFDFYDTSVRWLYNISDKDQLRVNFININNELVFNENVIINQIEESKESSLIQNSIAGGIYYKRDWSTKFSTTLQIYETDYKLKAINSDIVQQQRLLQENTVSETSVKLNSIFDLNSQFIFLNGYQYSETGITNVTDVDKPKLKQLVREVIREHGLYSQVSYESINQKFNIKAGARYSYIEKFNKHIVEPRVSLNYRLFSHINISAGGEFKHQYTSQIVNFQTDFLGIEKRRWRLSNNENIPIILSKQISGGPSYNNRGWLISLEGYFKQVEGITAQSQGFLNQYIFEKTIGTYHVKGAEFLINKRNKRFSNWLSYTYAVNEYTFNDLQEINFPNNLDITHGVFFGSSFTADNFKISAGLNWYTGKPTTKPVPGNEIINQRINFEAANSSRLDDYLRVDLSATYKFVLYKNTRAYIGASIWNSFNNKNTLYSYYRMEDNLPVEINQTALGITPNLTFRVEFGSID